jgi:hypothetical protein
MYVKPFENQAECLTPGDSTVSNFVTSRQCMYEKLEKQQLTLFWGRLKRLLVCHSASRTEGLNLLCHVIVLNVEHPMLPQLLLSRNFVEL